MPPHSRTQTWGMAECMHDWLTAWSKLVRIALVRTVIARIGPWTKEQRQGTPPAESMHLLGQLQHTDHHLLSIIISIVIIFTLQATMKPSKAPAHHATCTPRSHTCAPPHPLSPPAGRPTGANTQARRMFLAGAGAAEAHLRHLHLHHLRHCCCCCCWSCCC